MNVIDSVSSQHEAVAPLKSSPRAANRLLASSAHAARAAQSLAAGQVSAARGEGDAGSVATSLQKLATATALAVTADARAKTEIGLNLTA